MPFGMPLVARRRCRDHAPAITGAASFVARLRLAEGGGDRDQSPGRVPASRQQRGVDGPPGDRLQVGRDGSQGSLALPAIVIRPKYASVSVIEDFVKVRLDRLGR